MKRKVPAEVHIVARSEASEILVRSEASEILVRFEASEILLNSRKAKKKPSTRILYIPLQHMFPVARRRPIMCTTGRDVMNLQRPRSLS